MPTWTKKVPKMGHFWIQVAFAPAVGVMNNIELSEVVRSGEGDPIALREPRAGSGSTRRGV